MSIFEYVMVLVSVVLSLGLVHLLTGTAMLVRERARVRWSLVHALWMAEAVSIHLDLWTSLWTLHGAAQWSFAALLLAMTSAAMAYLTTALLVPEKVPAEGLDLVAYHDGHRREYLLAFMGYSLGAMLMNLSMLPAQYRGDIVTYAFVLPNLALLGTAWLCRNRWVQRIVPIAVLALDCYYFATNFPEIG